MFLKIHSPSTVTEWNKLYHNLWNENSFYILQKNISQLLRPTLNSFFNLEIALNYCNSKEIKLIKRLCTGLNHCMNPPKDLKNPFFKSPFFFSAATLLLEYIMYSFILIFLRCYLCSSFLVNFWFNPHALSYSWHLVIAFLS